MKQLLIENDAGKVLPDKNKKKIKEGVDLPEFGEASSNDNFINKPVCIPAILQKADVKNKNGRIYPRSILEEVVRQYQELINLKASFGETDHPEESVVSLKNVPHRIKRIWWVDNVVYGDLEIIISEGYKRYGIISCAGDNIHNLIYNYGSTIGISSRGVGSLMEIEGKNYVEDDFELIGWDLVHTPSTPMAYLLNEPEETISSKLTNIEESEQKTSKLIENIKKTNFLSEKRNKNKYEMFLNS